MYRISFALIVSLLIAQPATACLEWASYGTYDLGNWGDNNFVVQASPVGFTDHKLHNNKDWKNHGDDLIGLCHHNADFSATGAGNRWPEQRREIQVFFQERANACAAHFQKIYRKNAGRFCE